MNIMELGAIGELVGGVAVLVTLIFLVVQLRHSASATRMAVVQNATDSATAFLDHISSDRERAALWIKGLRDFSGLTADEFQAFHVLMVSMCRRWEGIVQVMRNGAIDDEDWAGSRSGMIAILRMPGARSWWKVSESLYNRAFRDFVEGAHRTASEPRWLSNVLNHLATLSDGERRDKT